MSKALNRTVTYARLHAGIFLENVGELGTIFPPKDKTVDNLQLGTTEIGLVISGIRRGYAFEALVPWSNVTHVALAPDETPKVKAVVTKNSSSDKS